MSFSRALSRGVVLAGFVIAILPAMGGRRVVADEPCEEFLQALLEKRYFDVALDYLDEMESSELAGEVFQRRIPLLRVNVLLDETATLRDNQRVTDQLDRTQKILDEFIAASPPADLLAEAQEQRANIAMGRARRLLDRATSDRITIQQRDEYQTQARAFLTEAGDTFESIRTRLRDEIENFRIDPQDPNSASRLEQLQNDYVKIRLKSPRVTEQIADSFGPGDPQYKQLLGEAADQYNELFEKYRTRLSGIDGRLGAARCYQKMGDATRALGYLLEVFDLPLGQIQNLKKREAALIALDAWSSQDPYPAQEAFSRLQPVIYSMPPDFARTPDGVRLRLEFAKVCHLLAEAIRANGASSPDERKQMTVLDREATNILRALSRMSGAHRDEARRMLDEWGNSVSMSDEGDVETGPPETMNEARQRGVDVQLVVADLKAALGAAREKLEDAAGSPAETELRAQVAALEEQLSGKSRAALKLFEIALSMSNAETPPDDISNLRYLQAASFFQMDRFFETTIIGEFLAERFPDASGTRPAVGLVCKAWWQMYRENQGKEGSAADTALERQQMKKYSEMIFSKWPGSEQAEMAGTLMTLVSLDQNDPQAADEYLAKIPQDSSTRSAVVLEVGNQMWRQYVLAQRKGEANPLVRDQAKTLLENGLGYLKVEDVTTYQARSALSLTELYLDAGENEAAVNQLEASRVAPLDLVKTKHPAAADARFRRDVFRTAVRAYLAMLRDGKDALQWVEKSQGVLAALRQDVGDEPDGQRQLAGIYLTLSRELKQQFDSLESADQRAAFATGLESFLEALADNTEDRQLMLLTGTMLTDIGSSLRESDLATQADRFFELAVKVYSTLGQSADPDPRVQLAIDRGRANSLRGSGRYEEAVKLFGDILENPENQRYRDLQVDAATAMAEWGLAKNDPSALVSAVQGGEKRSSGNTIMGWTNLAKSAQRERNTSLLAEAVWYIAQCKFRYGKITGKPEMQQSAVKEIRNFRESAPEMGGPQWKTRLESLLLQLDAQLKE